VEITPGEEDGQWGVICQGFGVGSLVASLYE
jgi:hypothetical protein